ncbi:MAG TPA: UDP-N-acetylmuramoyl-L-alanine--D-glutamate ligase, partial [Solirubrobacteraceae bacterium]|nr:UDP-N-acetylmuramoyl-L-alanine--D-glutamate ligase [Solirubrobacteraceae bacterium]
MRFSELDGRAVGVWGLGREIRSFARHLAERMPAARIAVVALDDPSEALPEELRGVPVTGPGAAAVEALGACDVVVRSPGVSIHRDELRTLAARGVPHVTATGLWVAERRGRRTIGITGTKGKSTTATAVAHLLRAAGERVELAGNIGRPALDLLDLDPEAWAVVELSSYQIADLQHGTQVAVMTNLYSEHVDWHGTAENYRREKLRLLALPGVEACVLRPADAEAVAAASKTARRLPFETPEGWHVTEDGGIVRGLAAAAPHLAAADLPLRGRHNAANLCAALSAVEAAGVALPADLPAALRGLEPLPHRLQTVLTSNGVDWVDDSISTTPESTLAALEAFAGRDIVLIAGGSDREQDFTALAAELARRG